MKINEIIRQKRTEKKLTQEQVAVYLGVTTPAVNKWEKGTSYPDITLLPALARLLDTDLNTLLSFQDDLTDTEIALFMNQVSEVISGKGFDDGYALAMEKLREFPTCYPLVLNIAMLLDGGLTLAKPKAKTKEAYEEEIEALYWRAAQGDERTARESAQARLAAKLMQRKDYDKAEELIQLLSDAPLVDKRQLEINLLIARGKLDEAAKRTEEKLLSETNAVHATLMTLMEIAIKDNRIADAEYIATADRQAAESFDLWEYNRYVSQFQLYSATKQRLKLLKLLPPMLKSLTKKWDINRSPLYRHIPTKETDSTFGKQMQSILMQAVREDEDTKTLADEPEFQKLEKELDLPCNFPDGVV